ncbi:MAG: hypothetical protein ACOZB3_08740 [Calditrichota bacterium]
MRYLTLTLSLIVFTTIAYADEWRPYVGAGGAFGVMTSNPDYVELDRMRWKPINSCSGSRIEIGIHNGKYEWYAALSLSRTPNERNYSYSLERLNDTTSILKSYYGYESWTETWLQIGYRVHPHAGSRKMNPLFGGALTLGVTKSIHTMRYEKYLDSVIYDDHGHIIGFSREQLESYEYRHTFMSPQCIGGTVEFGVSFPLRQRLELITMTDVHFYHDLTSGIFLTPSLIAQLQYRL